MHPAYKLEYFKSVGWEAEWLRVAEGLVRTEFKRKYAALPVVGDNGDDVSDGEQASQDEKVSINGCLFWASHGEHLLSDIRKHI